jgi:hypothetical protein
MNQLKEKKKESFKEKKEKKIVNNLFDNSGGNLLGKKIIK